MIDLTDLQLDALAEAFNIALGEAAAAFSELVREPVRIQVPSVKLLTPQAMHEQVLELYDEDGRSELCGIHQSFRSEDNLRADTILLFTESGSLDIIRQMLGEESPIETFTELEQDALGEIGNIIINSCMSSFADLFNVSFTGSLPTVILQNPTILGEVHREQEWILLAQIGLSLTNRDTTGFVLFIMDGLTIERFLHKIEVAFDIKG